MLRISTPDTLEVGKIVGKDPNNLFLRVFEKFEGEAELRHSYISHWDGHTFKILREFDYEIVDIEIDAEGTLHVLAHNGRYFRYAFGHWDTISEGLPDRVIQIKLLPSGVYALGKGKVYHLQGSDWLSIDTGFDRSLIFDLFQKNTDTLLFCGMQGALGEISKDGTVTLAEVPTNANLVSFWSLGSKVLICGGRSSLLIWYNDEVVPVATDLDTYNFFRFCEYNGRLLISTAKAIVEYTNESVEIAYEISSFRLYNFDNNLFSHGIDRIFRLIEENWFEFPVWLEIPETESARTQRR